MHYCLNYYFWCSEHRPDAVPAGMIAVDLGLNNANLSDDEIDQISDFCCDLGLFDDASYQLGFTNEDKDLIVRSGKGASYLTGHLVLADWQYMLVKKQPGLRLAEHDLEEVVEERRAFIEGLEEEDNNWWYN